MKIGYYVSLHAEILGNTVIPSTENIIDAHRMPILLVRASKVGIPTAPYLVTDSVKKIILEFNFPIAIFAVNPFSYNGFKIAKNRSALYRIIKSLSMNYKYAVCAQPFTNEMITFKSIFGKCEINDKGVKEISKQFYETFKIPICKLHVQLFEERACLCGLQPLKTEDILTSDLKIISEEISQMSKKAGLID
jgi:hypothetical protein